MTPNNYEMQMLRAQQFVRVLRIITRKAPVVSFVFFAILWFLGKRYLKQKPLFTDKNLQNEQFLAGAKNWRCKFLAFLHFFALVLEKKCVFYNYLQKNSRNYWV